MSITLIGVLSLAVIFGAMSVIGQPRDTAAAHVAVAKAAAGQEHVGLFDSLCRPSADPRPATQGPQPRSEWHAEPTKVFDNLYFVGQTEYSAWAVTTSDGIIIVDALWDYSVEDEIVNGLRKLGLDPAKIKYVLLSHGHIDHAGGARYLQDHFGARVIASAADWDLMDGDTGKWPKPKRDMVATDGQKLTLGDTTLTLYLTPGHTLGTISTLIPVKDAAASRTWLLSGAARHLTGSDRQPRTSRPRDPTNSGSRLTAAPRSVSRTSHPRLARTR